MHCDASFYLEEIVPCVGGTGLVTVSGQNVDRGINGNVDPFPWGAENGRLWIVGKLTDPCADATLTYRYSCREWTADVRTATVPAAARGLRAPTDTTASATGHFTYEVVLSCCNDEKRDFTVSIKEEDDTKFALVLGSTNSLSCPGRSVITISGQLKSPAVGGKLFVILEDAEGKCTVATRVRPLG